jgi:hypothetical protein
VALTLIVSVAPKSYLWKLIVIVHGPLGYLLLSVASPRLVDRLLTSESTQS